MQVLTLNESAFEEHAARLAGMVMDEESAGFDAIVAVKRGGSFVADAFCHHFPKERYAERYDVELQRPSTKRKGGLVSRILRQIPIPILNWMRMAESELLSLRRNKKREERRKTEDKREERRKTEDKRVEIPEKLAKILKDNATPEVLLIDDAIDSGETLLAIIEAIKDYNPIAAIRVAVFTETTSNPLLHADYSIYRNRTLIRFPWSNDYKKP